MASDSEATESGHTRYDVEKIWLCRGYLCGYAGNSAVRDRLSRQMAREMPELSPTAPRADRYQVGDLLQSIAGPVLSHAYSNFVPVTPSEHPGILAGKLLVIGHDDDGCWILELDHNNTVTSYTDAGFHTIGSGSAAAYVAHALMKGYDVQSRNIAALRLIAYRTVATCIDTLSGSLGVGGPVQLWSSNDAGAFEKAEGETLEVAANGVEQWMTIERESLDRVATRSPIPATDDVELPADLTEETERDTAQRESA